MEQSVASFGYHNSVPNTYLFVCGENYCSLNTEFESGPLYRKKHGVLRMQCQGSRVRD